MIFQLSNQTNYQKRTDSHPKNTGIPYLNKKQNSQKGVMQESLTCCDARAAAVDRDGEKDEIQKAKIIKTYFFL